MFQAAGNFFSSDNGGGENGVGRAEDGANQKSLDPGDAGEKISEQRGGEKVSGMPRSSARPGRCQALIKSRIPARIPSVKRTLKSASSAR